MRKIARILGVTALLAALLIPASAVFVQPDVVYAKELEKITSVEY